MSPPTACSPPMFWWDDPDLPRKSNLNRLAAAVQRPRTPRRRPSPNRESAESLSRGEKFFHGKLSLSSEGPTEDVGAVPAEIRGFLQRLERRFGRRAPPRLEAAPDAEGGQHPRRHLRVALVDLGHELGDEAEPRPIRAGELHEIAVGEAADQRPQPIGVVAREVRLREDRFDPAEGGVVV